MPIKLRERDDINILDIDGRIDLNSSDIIEMVGWLVNSGKLKIIMNFENVDIVDYNGLSILAIAYKNVINHGGTMRMLNVPLSVVEMLKVVKLDSTFEIFNDEDTAVQSFFDSGFDKLRLRRKFHRLDIHFGVRYKKAGDNKIPDTFSGDVLNMSAAGLYIYTPNTFPMNTMLDLQFVMPGAGGILASTGRVSWLADKDLQPHFYPGMGVSFSHLTSDKERSIADFIDKNVTHRTDSSE